MNDSNSRLVGLVVTLGDRGNLPRIVDDHSIVSFPRPFMMVLGTLQQIACALNSGIIVILVSCMHYCRLIQRSTGVPSNACSTSISSFRDWLHLTKHKLNDRQFAVWGKESRLTLLSVHARTYYDSMQADLFPTVSACRDTTWQELLPSEASFMSSAIDLIHASTVSLTREHASGVRNKMVRGITQVCRTRLPRSVHSPLCQEGCQRQTWHLGGQSHLHSRVRARRRLPRTAGQVALL